MILKNLTIDVFVSNVLKLPLKFKNLKKITQNRIFFLTRVLTISRQNAREKLAGGWRTAAILKPFHGKKRKKETLR